MGTTPWIRFDNEQSACQRADFVLCTWYGRIRRWPGPPPHRIMVRETILLETTNNVSNPTRCRRPRSLYSVRLTAYYTIQCLLEGAFVLPWCVGAGPPEWHAKRRGGHTGCVIRHFYTRNVFTTSVRTAEIGKWHVACGS